MLNTGLLKFFARPLAGVMLLTAATVALEPVNPVVAQQVREGRITSSYTLGGGDRIRVNIFEVEDYSGEYVVPPGGGINLPLIGSVNVEGLTTEQAAEVISQRYSRFLRRPITSVNLLSPRPINVLVAGEVTTPGAYTLSLTGGRGDQPGVQYPTILAALTTAQGVTLSADIRQVQLRRRIAGGRLQTVTVNLDDLIKTGRSFQDITLRDGDTVFVPTSKNFDVAGARNLAAANFAADPTRPRTVAVVGEVNNPGTHLVTTGGGEGGGQQDGNNAPNFSGQPTVTRALQLAGGITPTANVRNVIIRRRTRTGKQQIINLDLWKLLTSGDVDQDVIVQDGDTIVLPTATEVNPAEATQLASTTLSPSEIQVNVVGEVKEPGPVEIKPNSSLNQALLAAGGFNDARATSGKVDLIRLNPDGSVTKRLVKVDLKAPINEKTNPIIRSNDVVLVSRSGLAKTGDTVNTVAGPLGVILNLLGVFGIFR